MTSKSKLLSLVLISIALLAVPLSAQAGAAYLGTPGAIVFPAYQDLLVPEGEILAIQHEGGLVLHGPQQRDEPSHLTEDWRDSEPAPSPDGRLIAFVGEREPNGRGIYAIRPDGTGLRFLTKGGDPYFSPDSRLLLFVRGAESNSHLYVLALATGTVRQLTFGEHQDSTPVFTPDARRVLFTSNRKVDAKTDDSDIWIVPAGGGKPRVLIDGRGAESSPDVSPDGKRIVYVVEKELTGGILWIARRNGKPLRVIAGERNEADCRDCYSAPAFAPDGKHVVALQTTDSRTVIVVMRRDGKNRKSFSAGVTEVEGLGRHVGEPAWGPRPK